MSSSKIGMSVGNDQIQWTKNLHNFVNFNIGLAMKFFEAHGYKKRQEDRGFKFFKEGYIHDVSTHEMSVQARCYRSQRKNLQAHKLHITFEAVDDSLTVKEAHCSCEVGNSQSCHHILALTYYLQDKIYSGLTVIAEDVSCTSRPMEWNKPRGKKNEPTAINTAVFANPNNVNRKKRPIESTFRMPFKNTNLAKVSVSDVELLKMNMGQDTARTHSYLLNINEDSENHVPVLNDLTMVPKSSILGLRTLATPSIDKPPPLKIDNKQPLPIKLPMPDSEIDNILRSMPPIYHSKLEEVSFDTAIEFEHDSRLQSQSSKWRDLRKYRITSSKFGEYHHKRLFNERFIRDFFSPPDLSNIKSVKHGLTNESVAIAKYLTLNNTVKYHKCGLMIHPYASHLGASPDGLIYKPELEEFGLLEIKCPLSKKATALNEYYSLKSFCLTRDNNLKKQHHYYCQVQGQMLLTGLRWCDLVVYIQKTDEMVVVNVPFDAEFCMEMYVKLTTIYKTYILPQLDDH